MRRFFAGLTAFVLLLTALPHAGAAASDGLFTAVEIEYIIDETGTAQVSMDLELELYDDADALVLALPDGAEKAEAKGWDDKFTVRDGRNVLVLTEKGGFEADDYDISVEFTCTGMVKAAEDGQVLTVPLLAGQDFAIEALEFAVELPESFTSNPKFSAGYAGAVIEDTLVWYKDGADAVTGRIAEPLMDHDTLDMTLSVPDGYFTVRIVSGGAFQTVFAIIALLLAALAVVYWWLKLKNRPLQVRARTLPPDGVNPGDVPYLLGRGEADFNMLVSHWATLGYLSFYINRGGHVILRRRMAMGNERRAFERRLFELLFGNEDYCDGASLRYKKVGEKAMEIIPAYWNKRLYEKKSGSPLLAEILCCLSCAVTTMLAMDKVAPEVLHGLFLCVAFVAGFALCRFLMGAFGGWYLGNLLRVATGAAAAGLLLILGSLGDVFLLMLPVTAAAAFLGWQTVHGGLRTPYGSEVIAQTMGFRRFLHNASDRHLTQTLYRDPQYFYRILPYAQAMGQGRRLANLLSEMELEPCQWYETADNAPMTAGRFYDHYVETLAMLNVSIRK